MKYLLLGNDIFSTYLYKGLLDRGHECIKIITKPKDYLPTGHTGLVEFANSKKINCDQINNINLPENVEKLKQLNLDFIISAWPDILSREVIAIPKIGIIGSHPTPLPYGRGRHPLHWLIYLGVTEYTLSFFQVNSSIDGGDILVQESFNVPKDSGISLILQELNMAGYRGATKIGDTLSKNNFLIGIPQSTIKTPYFRARTLHDLYIDFRNSGQAICNLINSYTNPFHFAKLLTQSHNIPIIDGKITTDNYSSKFTPPGYILDVNKHYIDIQAYDSVVRLKSELNLNQILTSRTYIYPPSYYFEKLAK